MTGLLTDFINSGLRSARPASPDIPAGTVSYYLSTDKLVLSVYIKDTDTWYDAAPSQYIFGFFFEEPPEGDEVLLRHTAGADFTIPADFAGALEGNIGTNPAAAYDLDVQHNGVSIGTISVTTGGVISAVTDLNEAKDLTRGDELTVVAPTVADSTIANSSLTFIGAR